MVGDEVTQQLRWSRQELWVLFCMQREPIVKCLNRENTLSALLFKKYLSGYCSEDGLQWVRGKSLETTYAGVIINRNSRSILVLRSSFIG